LDECGVVGDELVGRRYQGQLSTKKTPPKRGHSLFRYWLWFFARSRVRVGTVSRLRPAGRFRRSWRIHIVSLGIQPRCRLWLRRSDRPSLIECVARSPITVDGVRLLGRGEPARQQERSGNDKMLAHDILLPVNAWGIEAFRDASDINSMRNPQVRAAIYDVMRFRLRPGVDGFRVDVVWHLIKDDLLRAPR
jgi:hypothetical protein